jgi:hypothetical protein
VHDPAVGVGEKLIVPVPDCISVTVYPTVNPVGTVTVTAEDDVKLMPFPLSPAPSVREVLLSVMMENAVPPPPPGWLISCAQLKLMHIRRVIRNLICNLDFEFRYHVVRLALFHVFEATHT